MVSSVLLRQATTAVLLVLLLFVGGCMKFEIESGPSPRGADHRLHNVREGDTLFSIGKRYGASWQQLAERNRIEAPYDIFVGQQLYIDESRPQTARFPGVVLSEPQRPAPVRSAPVVKPAVKAPLPEVVARQVAVNSGPVRFDWPVDGGNIISGFGQQQNRVHDGIDIAVPELTNVRAASGGTVVYAGEHYSGYGNLIILRHDNNYFTTYAHNNRLLVAKGQIIRGGQPIALSGHTGRVSGPPHLHFELRRGSTPLNPLAYLPRR